MGSRRTVMLWRAQTLYSALVAFAIAFFYAKSKNAMFAIEGIEATLNNNLAYVSYHFGVYWLAMFLGSLAIFFSFNSFRLQCFLYAFSANFWALFALSDLKVYLNQGLHLYDWIVISTFMNPDFHREVNIGQTTLLLSLGLFFTNLVLHQWFLQKMASSKMLFRRLAFPLFPTLLTLIALISLVLSLKHFIKPLKPMARFAPLFSEFFLPWPNQEEVALKKTSTTIPELQTASNIALIAVESLRGDFATPQRMPKTFEVLQKFQCRSLPKHLSGGHTTEYGVFSLLQGVYGHHYNLFRDNHFSPLLTRSLKASGYSLQAATASMLKHWNKAFFNFSDFDHFHEFASRDLIGDDQKVLEWGKQTWEKHYQNGNGRLMSFMFFNSTHHSYSSPPEFHRFAPAYHGDFNHLTEDSFDSLYRTKLFNSYQNSVLYIDSLIADFLLNVLPRANPSDLFMITGDHGEEFWEYQTQGHTRPQVTWEKLHVPFFICGQEFLKRLFTEDRLTTHLDVSRTLLTYLSHIDPNSPKQSPLHGENWLAMPEERYHFASVSHFPFNHGQAIVVDEQKRVSSFFKSGEHFLDLVAYDLGSDRHLQYLDEIQQKTRYYVKDLK